MFNLLPREETFFEIFEQAAQNVHEGALALVELLEKFDNLVERAKHIKDIEHRGDQLTHDTMNRLNKTFITPLDREDIHELGCRLDDILDLIDTAVNRMVLYKIDKPTDDARELARCIQHATALIVEAMPMMRNMRNGPRILRQCANIHTQENEADRIEQHALASLFEGGHDPTYIIKWKDVYEDLEMATDKCEDVANVLEGIVLKNA